MSAVKNNNLCAKINYTLYCIIVLHYNEVEHVFI